MKTKKIDINLGNQTNRIESEHSVTKLNTPLWYGRSVEQLTQKRSRIDHASHFYNFAPQKAVPTNIEVGSHQYELIDCDEDAEETHLDFNPDVGFSYSHTLHHPSEREFTFADQMDANNIHCKSFLKRVVKGVKKIGKGVKKVGKGIGKGIKKGTEGAIDFVKEHKREMLIAIGILAASVGAYALSAGAFGSATATPQGSSGTNRKKEDENDPEPVDPAAPPPPNDPPGSENSAPTQQGKIGIMEQFGKSLNSQTPVPNPFTPPKGCAPEPSTPYKSAITSFIEQTRESSNGGGISKSPPPGSPAQFDLQKTIPQGPARSCHFQTDGMKFKGLSIGFINGMNTSCVEHWNHLNHVKKYAGDLSIQGVYNHSNTPVVDLLEIFTLNYHGAAPITADLLLDNWGQFHEENKDNPHAKYLQFSHSMGTIQAKIALEKAPQEIRDRVIVVAIGPAVIIPEGLCFDSYNYASKKDKIHLGENLVTLLAAGSHEESDQKEMLDRLIENKNQLIILEPHLEATGLDHDFESPTYREVIRKHVIEYLSQNGQY